MKNHFTIILTLFFWTILFSQETPSEEKLEEVIITSSRIDLLFSENSRTIIAISSEEIKNSTATNVADLLQTVAGVDIRKRGIDGMQSDIYIRGGNFNQTLILIDGFKTEDPQTGHHTMNMMVPLENIERIEIIKGPAARIYGQNAFSGAINIVTKKKVHQKLKAVIGSGSFNKVNTGVTAATNFEKSNHFVNFEYNSSDGYRDNTDYENLNYFLKSSIHTKNQSIDIIATFIDRKFGANNFYTNNPDFNEYEETQTSLVGISTSFVKNNWTFKPKIYWKRGQDMFLLKREDPSFSRNFNISNKVAIEMNSSYKSTLGITGIGVDVSETTLSSNNLGDQNRTAANMFIEHRFLLFDKQLDITPGASLNYYSDFDFQFLPGLDVGYKFSNNFKIYGNIGYTYRVPTYTELYISIPNFLSGNSELQPEKALSEEIGVKYTFQKMEFTGAFFRKDAEDLIDYIKETEDSPLFVAQNLRKISTTGFELSVAYKFLLFNNPQRLNLGYTFLEDDYNETYVFASRYLIDTSIKHHFTALFDFTIAKLIKPSITYKFVERPTNSYSIVDAKISTEIKSFSLFLVGNNIFNTEYSEKDNVPMPKGNLEFGLSYTFQ
ncbi:MAG: TonB-dependent receptor [Flavobacteriaceae bacterium]